MAFELGHHALCEGCWLYSWQRGRKPGWHICKQSLHKRHPGKPCPAELVAFQLSPGLHTGTYCLAKPGHSCFLQSCLYLLAAALPEPRQPLPLLSFEPLNAAGSKAGAPRARSQPCTAARFAYATHFGGARASVSSQTVILHNSSFSPVALFPTAWMFQLEDGEKAFPKVKVGGQIPQDRHLPPLPAALSTSEPSSARRAGARWELNPGDPISSPLL